MQRTLALYTLISVAFEMSFRFHTFQMSRPKAALAFASLVLSSSPMTIDLERVLLRYLNFFTTLSRCPLMVILGSMYGFLGASWSIIFVFFVLMVGPKLSQAFENLSTQFCMLALVLPFSAQSSANRNWLMISVFTLAFAWSLLRLKTKPSLQYRMSIPIWITYLGSSPGAANLQNHKISHLMYMDGIELFSEKMKKKWKHRYKQSEYTVRI